jgi:DNA-binding transcriptional regulator YiaG
VTCPATVKRIRAKGKLTQLELATLLQVSSQTVSNWESGRTKPDVYNGAILIRLKMLVRSIQFPAYLTIALRAQRDVRTGRYVRMYDLLSLLFQHGK